MKFVEYKVASLFAGVGGICLGFKNAKYKDLSFKLEWANEIDEYAAETYRTNFSHQLYEGDIEKIVDLESIENEEERNIYREIQEEILKKKIDILTGGFPCQAFSIAGEQKGFEDDRGNLFLSIIKLIELLNHATEKPQVLFLENVKNLKGHDEGNTYRIIKQKLQEIGYTIKEAVLNTKDFSNLPQNRERIYIVGFLDKKHAEKFIMFEKEEIEKFKKVFNNKERIQNIRSVIDYSIENDDMYSKYYYTKEKYPNYFTTEEQYNQLTEDKKKKHRINIVEDIVDEFEFYQVRRGMYVRKNKNGVCPTLTANMGTGGHNVPLIKVGNGIRKLTPAEVFKLQGFPIGNGYQFPKMYKNKQYLDSKLYKQAGNAVSVDIIELIATEILKVLHNDNDEYELGYNQKQLVFNL